MGSALSVGYSIGGGGRSAQQSVEGGVRLTAVGDGRQPCGRVSNQRFKTFEGEFVPPEPPAPDLAQPPAPVALWVSQETASRRLNVRLPRVAELVADGLLVGEWGANSSCAPSRGKPIPHSWWIEQASLLALIDAQPTGSLMFDAIYFRDRGDRDRAARDTEGLAVLYGLLGLADVRELAKRRARFEQRAGRMPLPVYDPETGGVRQCPD